MRGSATSNSFQTVSESRVNFSTQHLDHVKPWHIPLQRMRWKMYSLSILHESDDTEWTSFTESYRVLQRFTKFYVVLLNFTELYRVLPRFHKFYRVLPSFTKFYRVLLNFTKLYRFPFFNWILPSFVVFSQMFTNLTEFYWVSNVTPLEKGFWPSFTQFDEVLVLTKTAVRVNLNVSAEKKEITRVHRSGIPPGRRARWKWWSPAASCSRRRRTWAATAADRWPERPTPTSRPAAPSPSPHRAPVEKILFDSLPFRAV